MFDKEGHLKEYEEIRLRMLRIIQESESNVNCVKNERRLWLLDILLFK